MEFDATGAVRRPTGNRHPRHAPHGVYRTRDDGWVALAAESDAVWAALADCLGVDDRRFATEAGRKAHEAEIDIIVADWCAARDAAQAADTLVELGVAAARVESFQELYANLCAQFRQRGFMVPVTHPEAGTHYLPMGPWGFSQASAPPATYSPRFGEHSAEVLGAELGIRPEEYEELVALGVTGTTRLP